MSIPEKNYTSKNTLLLRNHESNPYIVAVKFYSECYSNYFKNFFTTKDLETELTREDVNTVCLKELEDLRKVVPDIRYKEVASYQELLPPNCYFYEEMWVKNRL
jgi:hypothetical protein